MSRTPEVSTSVRPLPKSARIVYTIFGVFFIAMAGTLAIITSPMDWRQALLVLVILAIGIDSIVGAVRNRWPKYASFYI